MHQHEAVLLFPALRSRLAIGRPGSSLPAAETLDRYLRVELEGVGPFAVAKGLVGVERARSQALCARGNRESVEVRLRHMQRPAEEVAPGFCRDQFVIAEFMRAGGRRPDIRAQHMRDLL
jgi:hypothetical protein